MNLLQLFVQEMMKMFTMIMDMDLARPTPNQVHFKKFNNKLDKVFFLIIEIYY